MRFIFYFWWKNLLIFSFLCKFFLSWQCAVFLFHFLSVFFMTGWFFMLSHGDFHNKSWICCFCTHRNPVLSSSLSLRPTQSSQLFSKFLFWILNFLPKVSLQLRGSERGTKTGWNGAAILDHGIRHARAWKIARIFLCMENIPKNKISCSKWIILKKTLENFLFFRVLPQCHPFFFSSWTLA